MKEKSGAADSSGRRIALAADTEHAAEEDYEEEEPGSVNAAEQPAATMVANKPPLIRGTAVVPLSFLSHEIVYTPCTPFKWFVGGRREVKLITRVLRRYRRFMQSS